MVIVMRMKNVLGDQKFSTGLPRGQKQRVSSVLRQKTSAKSYYDDKDERRAFITKALAPPPLMGNSFNHDNTTEADGN